jgi:queuosine precursor transporter
MVWFWGSVFVGSIVLANAMTASFGLVPIGFGLMVTAGTFAAGVSLVARDAVHRSSTRLVVLALIAIGALLSGVLAPPMIAVASGVAFAVSELVDWAVFVPLSRRNLPAAVVVSSLVAAPVDTVLFLQLAGFGVTVQAVVGQVVVKTLIAALAAAVIVYRGRRAVPVGQS